MYHASAIKPFFFFFSFLILKLGISLKGYLFFFFNTRIGTFSSFVRAITYER